MKQQRERLYRALNHHCELSLSRISPPNKWCWKVIQPDGHIYSVGASTEDYEAAVDDMRIVGASALQEADRKWREMHSEDAWNQR